MIQMSFNHYDFYSDDHIIDLVWRRLEGTEVAWLPLQDIITDNRSKTKGLTLSQARNILSMSDGTDDDEQRKLLEFFWGPESVPKPKEPYNKEPKTCSHDWIEVILFHTPQMRCRWCDVKKS